ncbi:hypothetical protein [Glutamicibacter ardleyensis]|uniref:hypothetical protein n=1 Tax=Glutamicibacter ardleyensis TaxID=225894 RepID=UPI003FD09559
MPSPDFRSFRELDDATLAQKLSLGVSGTTRESNAERVKIAEVLEGQRLDYINSQYTQHQSHEHLSTDEALPADRALAAILQAQGDIQKVLNKPRCAANLIEDADEEIFHFLVSEKQEEVTAAVEDLHRDYGVNFEINDHKDLINAPLSQQITLGIDGNLPNAVTLRQERFQLFQTQRDAEKKPAEPTKLHSHENHEAQAGPSAEESSAVPRTVKARAYAPFPRPSGRSTGTNGIVPPNVPPAVSNGCRGPSL